MKSSNHKMYKDASMLATHILKLDLFLGQNVTNGFCAFWKNWVKMSKSGAVISSLTNKHFFLLYNIPAV